MNTNESYFLPLIQIPGQEDPLELEETPDEIPSNYNYNHTNQKLSFMDTLYIGSLTVVGLFIVFRFIQRSR